MTRILVIEDETFLREELLEWMAFENYDAIRAENGLAGVELAIQHHPDLIICDVTMPGLDGYGVLRQLRSNSATAAIPFIFMTARATQDDILQGIESGVDEYITKPFFQKDLLHAIERRLNQK